MQMINLMRGDCLELMKTIPDKSVDMVLTDPPYGTTACKWDVVIPFEPMWQQLKRITKDNGAICLFGSEPFSSALRISNIKEFKFDWIWDKVKPVGAHVSKLRPLQATEIISIFGQGKINYFPQMVKRDKPRTGGKSYAKTNEIMGYTIKDSERENKVYSEKFPVNLIRQSNADNTNRFHPTQKPVALLEYLIKTYTLENETVLDFTMGSGSTGVACVNLNRAFVGIEKDNNYFEIAQKRISEAQLKQ
jgi:DNA modification methylase